MIELLIAKAVGVFAGRGLIIAAVSAAVVMVLTWDRARISAATETGREQVRVETRNANDAVVSTADRIRARAQSGSVRGKRDPYTNGAD